MRRFLAGIVCFALFTTAFSGLALAKDTRKAKKLAEMVDKYETWWAEVEPGVVYVEN